MTIIPPLARVRNTRRIALSMALLLASATIAVSVPQRADANGTCLLDGDGVAPDPYLVGTAEDLKKVGVGECSLGAHYLQVADVTLFTPEPGQSNFTRIGIDVFNPFTGVYDGGKHRITGLVIDTTGDDVGMFGATGSNSVLRNIRMVDVSVKTDGVRVGSLVGWNFGRIENVSVNGAVVTSTHSSLVGGVVGHNDNGGRIASVSVMAATISADVSFAGGVVGYEDAGEIRNVYVIGTNVSAGAVNAYAGGIVGQAETGSVIQNVFASAVASGQGFVGSLAGSTNSDITASFFDVEVSENSAPAGASGFGTNIDATGKTTAEMTSFATFAAVWNTDGNTVIVEGWQAPNNPTWGICSQVNDGYPFLLWEYDTDPCSAAVVETGVTASTFTLSCAGPLVVGATITCTVGGGDGGIEILWRAAHDLPFAGAGVTLDADGAGMFVFVIPAAAVGRELTVELVEWRAPMSLGVVGGPVPASVPAGEGRVPLAVWLLALLAAVGAVLVKRGPVVV